MEDYKHKNDIRNVSFDNEDEAAEEVKDMAEEVRFLIRSKKDDSETMKYLRKKYGNDSALIKSIRNEYAERLRRIVKKANSFRRVMYDKFQSEDSISFSNFMKKADKYRKKYNISSDEYQIFLTHVLSDPKNRISESTIYTKTAIGEALGVPVTSPEKLKYGPSEGAILQDILRMNAETKQLHSSVFLQSLTYSSYAQEALSGTFNREKHNPYSYVHPIVAALFLPKINMLDELMLQASISNIVKTKHEGRSIVTKPDYGLFLNITTDPNDTVCDVSSPLADLKNRVILQTRLWESVLSLRQGKYFNDNLVNFFLAIDSCRNNIYDIPDLTYVKDEGAVIRRLLSAFSIRPTVVSTRHIYTLSAATPYVSRPPDNIVRLPMITVRLPVQSSSEDDDEAVQLRSAIEQFQWFIEDKRLVPKSQSIIYSHEVLIFCVPRRHKTVNIGRLGVPYNFSQLPMTISGLEKVNTRLVDFPLRLAISDLRYTLASVVFAKTHDYRDRDSGITNRVVVGNATALITEGGGEGENTRMFVYDPQSTASFTEDNDPRLPIQYVNNQTLADYGLAGDDAGGIGADMSRVFLTMLQTHGTIFIYTHQRNERVLIPN